MNSINCPLCGQDVYGDHACNPNVGLAFDTPPGLTFDAPIRPETLRGIIGPFRNEWAFLSNFYLVPIVHLGVGYPSVENAYQAMKAPTHERGQFTQCSAAISKRIGRRFKLPFNWDNERIHLMTDLVRLKFSGGSPIQRSIRSRLIDTGERPLVELNWWNDTFWGVCKGIGENNLGKILMQIRKELR